MNPDLHRVYCDVLEQQSLTTRCQFLYFALCAHGHPSAEHQAHDGMIVEFWRDTFGHAFKPTHNGKKQQDQIDLARVKRMQWILPVISGEVAGVRCYEVPPDGFYKPPPSGRYRRLYVLESELYVVWLQPKDTPDQRLKFASAYKCTQGQLDNYLDGAFEL